MCTLKATTASRSQVVRVARVGVGRGRRGHRALESSDQRWRSVRLGAAAGRVGGGAML